MAKPRILIAGATGAIGLPLAELLARQSFTVFGMTRRVEKAPLLTAVGAEPVIADVYDIAGLSRTLKALQPEIVFHQLTDLPFGLPPEKMAEGLKNNDHIRVEGTKNLLRALDGSPVRRLIAQSIAFRYADGPLPHRETDPLGSAALEEFERMILSYRDLGQILRFGRFYGPRTGVDALEDPCKVQVLAAAKACLAVLGAGAGKVYNVTEESAYADNARIIRDTAWNPRDFT